MRSLKNIFLIMIFCVCLNVKAIDQCSTEEMNRLKDLANKVQFKTNYNVHETESEGNIYGATASYNIELVNNNEDFKYYYSSSSIQKREINLNQISNITFSDGEVVTFYIYSYTTNLCTDELLRTETIKFPIYNSYYYINKDKCSEYPDFKYCREFMDIGNISYSEIDKEFEEYTKGDVKNKVLDFVQKNIYYVIGGGVILIAGIIYLITFIKRKKGLSDL